MKISIFLGLLAGCLGVQAALVSSTGYTNDFSVQPGLGDWSTYSLAGSSTGATTSNDMATAVQALSASTISTVLFADTANPPAARAEATWSSAGQYLQTRPTGNNGTLLMVTLQNNSGAAVAQATLSYDFAKTVETAEEINGHVAFYSLGGAAGTWVAIPEFNATTAGRLVAQLNVNWPVGGMLYVVWADDNGSPGPDGGFTLDNFSVSVASAEQTPAAITQSPASQTVVELATATLTAAASGNPVPGFQWYRGGDAIAGATNGTLILEDVPLAWDQAQFTAVAFNLVSNVTRYATSQVALLTVRPDTNAPALVAAYAEGLNLVQVIFSEAMAPATATNPANYVITSPGGNLVVSNAAVGASRSNIMLTVSRMTENATYTLKVNGLTDRAQAANPLPTNSTTTFLAVSFNNANVGAPAMPGSVSTVTGGFDVAGGGTNIGGASDQFYFVHQQRVGDFDVSVRLEAMSPSDAWAKAGLMARETLGVNSAFAASLATPGSVGALFMWRATTGAAASSTGGQPVNYPYTFVRLKRSGSVFTGYLSYDGQTWVQTGTATLTMPAAVYLGMAATARTTNRLVQVEFRDFAPVANPLSGGVRLSREPLGPSSRKTCMVITEFMFKPAPRADTNDLEFVELYNSNPYFEDISGWRLAGDIDFKFPPGTVVRGGEFLVVAVSPASLRQVYGLTNVMGPYTNHLKAAGRLQLRTEIDALVLEVNYKSENPWPAGADGTGHSLVLARPSYGEDWAEAWDISAQVGGSPGAMDGFRQTPRHRVVINEFLAHTDLPQLDYIELYNHGAQAVDLSGCALSDNPATNKFTFAQGATIPADGFLSLTEAELGFALSAAGETIYFRNAGDNAVLDCVRFKGQANGVATGRFPDGASEFYPLQSQTPGTNNSAIRVHDLVINEIMAQPLSELADDEYVELYNQGTAAVDLGGWRLRDGISYTFASNTVIAARGYLVVAKSRTNLLAKYAGLSPAQVVGDYSGTLSSRGERLALAMPDTIQTLATNFLGQVSTNVATIHIDVDEVSYRPAGHWGKWAAGGGSSLELVDPRSNHRLAANWKASDETAKAPWCTVEFTGPMDLGAQTASHFEVLALEEGEFLVDNVAVLNSGGVNLIPTGDSNFETGGTGWLMRGNHARSTVDASGGEGGGRCLHVRASGRGDAIANRALVPLSSVPSSGTFTLRARVRWLCGWPEMVIRLHGNYIEATRRLETPANLGTPGARNSRFATNAPPAAHEVSYAPILPAVGEAVVVTALVQDPDGVAAVQLKYRVDPAGSYTTVAMVDNGTGGDAIAGDGVYSATIPSPAAAALVAFQVTATDSRGLTSVYPEGAAVNTRECLVRFGEAQYPSSFGTYRMYFTQAAVNSWINRPVLSNEPVEGTFVYGNCRVVHHIGSRYAGSPYHQGFDSPVGSPCHYSTALPKDDLLLGTDTFNKLHAPGNGAFDDPTLLREQTAYWVARQTGVPWLNRRYVALHVNGVRRGTFMEDMQTPNGDVTEQYWPDDPNGQLYKLQPWFEQPDVATGASSPVNNQSWCTLNPYYSQGQHKLARYRHNYLTRVAHGTANDYSEVFALVDAAAQNGNAFVAGMEELVDTDEWLKVFAVEHAVGNWDSFGNQNAQNMYGYKGDFNKWRLIIFDLNIVLNNPNDGGSQSDAPGGNLFNYNNADSNMGKFYSTTKYRRAYLRALKQVANGPFNNPVRNDFIDARYEAFMLNGQTSVKAPSAVKTFINSARSGILSTVAAEDAAQFVVAGGAQTQTTNLITLRGQAPVEAYSITINGREYPTTWTSVKDWTVNLAVAGGTNNLVIEGRDQQGNPIAGMEVLKTVVFEGAAPDPAASLMFSEIMYAPVSTNAEYVEIFNAATNFTFDLSNWRVNGLGYTFPFGAVITPQSRLILARDRQAFAAAYGASVQVYDVFPGALQRDGETLTLFRPNPAGGELVVNRVRYEPAAPWPLRAAGGSAAMQLVDAQRDNSRPLNWAAGDGWRFKVFTVSNALVSTQLQLRPSGAGELYLDGLRIEEGRTVGGGTNLLVNGDFEEPLAGTWNLGTYVQQTTLSTEQRVTGNSSLRLVATNRAITSAQTITQPLVLKTGAWYTVSLWFMPSTTITGLELFVTAAFVRSNMPVGSVNFFRSPGQENPVAQALPELPLVYLNEVQAENVTGPADNFGAREPWLELYNRGTNAVDLTGWYLANNYTNLAQWAFPAGTVLQPGEFRMIWADGEAGETAGTNLHTSFRLAPGQGSVALVMPLSDGLGVLDYLNYTNLTADTSYGDYPDGQMFDRQTFRFATPGWGNNSSLSLPVIKINEWMADNTLVMAPGGLYEDWFELYNPGANPVDLTGFYLSDTNANKFQFRIPAGYVVPPKGWLLVWADNAPARNNSNDMALHVNFALSRRGESIGLYGPDGSTMDEVVFGPQTSNVSEGRYPDGSATLVFMTTASPGRANVYESVVAQPPEFTAGGVQVGSGQVVMKFSTVPGNKYQTQYKNRLTDAQWQALEAPKTATGPSMIITDTTPDRVSRYYRVIEVP